MMAGLTLLYFILMVIAHCIHVRSLRLEHESDLKSARRAGHRDGYSTGYNECLRQYNSWKD